MSLPAISVPIVGDISGLQGAITKANVNLYVTETRTAAIARNLFMAGQNMRRIGWASLAAFTAPAVLLGKTAVSSYAQFNQAMTQSLAIAGDVSEGLRKEAEETAKTLSTKLAISAKELGDSYFYLISAGLDLQQSIKALPVVAKFAQAGLFDMAMATEYLTDAQSALGLVSKDPIENMKMMTYLGDLLVKANQTANASVEQFSRALTNQAAAASRIYGVSVEDTIATLATMADQGLKNQVAGMRYSMMLRGMTFAAVRNEGAMRKMGVAIFDSFGKMRPLYEIINNLEQALGNLSTEQKVQQLMSMGFTERSLGGIMTLLGTSAQMWKNFNIYTNEAKGSIDEVVEKQLKSFTNQLTLIKNKLTVIAIEIGERIGPYILKYGNKLVEYAERFNSLSDEAIMRVVKLVAGLALIGPSFLMLGGILMVASALVATVGKALILLRGAAGVVALVYLKFKSLYLYLNAFALTFLKIKMLLWTIFSPVLSAIGVFIASMMIGLKNVTVILAGALLGAFKGIGLAIGAMVGGIVLFAAKISVILLPLVAALYVGFRMLGQAFDGEIGDSFKNFFKNIPGFLLNFQENMTIAFDNIKDNWDILLANMLIAVGNFAVNWASIMVASSLGFFKKYGDFWGEWMAATFLPKEEQKKAKQDAVDEFHSRSSLSEMKALVKEAMSKTSQFSYLSARELKPFNYALPEKSERDWTDTESDWAKKIREQIEGMMDGLESSALTKKTATWAEFGTGEFYKAVFGDREDKQISLLAGIEKNTSAMVTATGKQPTFVDQMTDQVMSAYLKEKSAIREYEERTRATATNRAERVQGLGSKKTEENTSKLVGQTERTIEGLKQIREAVREKTLKNEGILTIL